MQNIALMNSCSSWRSWRGGRSDVWESRAALLAYYELEVVNSNVAEDFVAPLGGDDHFVIQHRFVKVNSAQAPLRNSIFGSQIPDQFLGRGTFEKKITMKMSIFTLVFSSSAISVSIFRNFIPASSYIKVMSSFVANGCYNSTRTSNQKLKQTSCSVFTRGLDTAVSSPAFPKTASAHRK